MLGRFKDYIAMPKFNLYQSLHTTVIGPEGKAIEVQIRTREMHQRAEWGVAAHWSYKEGSPADDIAWLNRMIDWQRETSDPAVFMETLKTDLEQDEVFVFTPKGKVITLPVGSSPVDFAYSVHTEVGHACIGARVNGRLVPLDHKLQSGDTCEIFTSKVEGAGPSRDWLKLVASPRARNKIRQWFSRERRDDAMDSGREELIKELRREGLPVQKMLASDVLAREAAELKYTDLDAMVRAIGEHHVSGKSVAQRLARRFRSGEEEEQLPVTVRTPRRQRKAKSPVGVHVEGLDDVMVRLSRCCTPVPGDEIIGFITRGPRGERAPGRLRQRRLAVGGPDGAHDRGRVGQRGRPELVHRLDRGEGPRPLEAPARRVERHLRAPGEHRGLLHAHRLRSHLQDALRLRDGRPQPPRRRHPHDQDHRRRLRRLPPGAGSQEPRAARRGTRGRGQDRLH